MPGYNHLPGCTCGWCLKSGRSSRSPTRGEDGPSWLDYYQSGKYETLRSYTIPNAPCPVCGENVFFYRAESGGSVFFDSLGPPWPKHPCTDKAGPAKKSRNRASAVRFVSEGINPPPEVWVPVQLSVVAQYENWKFVEIKELQTGRKRTRLINASYDCPKNPAFFTNCEGGDKISWLRSAETGVEPIISNVYRIIFFPFAEPMLHDDIKNKQNLEDIYGLMHQNIMRLSRNEIIIQGLFFDKEQWLKVLDQWLSEKLKPGAPTHIW